MTLYQMWAQLLEVGAPNASKKERAHFLSFWTKAKPIDKTETQWYNELLKGLD
jgi:hypothetical protein